MVSLRERLSVTSIARGTFPVLLITLEACAAASSSSLQFSDSEDGELLSESESESESELDSDDDEDEDSDRARVVRPSCVFRADRAALVAAAYSSSQQTGHFRFCPPVPWSHLAMLPVWK